MPLDIYGVRYPDAAQQKLQQYGGRYHGWLANAVSAENSIRFRFLDKDDIDGVRHVQNAGRPVIEHVGVDRQSC